MTDPQQFRLVIRTTVDEGGLILEALAELPFKTVFELIGNINAQANSFLLDQRDTEEIPFNISLGELQLLIGALSELPFNRVNALLQKIEAQLQGSASARDIGHERS